MDEYHFTARSEPAEGGPVPPPPRTVTAIPAAAASRRPRRVVGQRRLLGRAVRIGVAAALAATAVFSAFVLAYRFVDPPVSTLMLIQKAGGVPIRQNWVPLQQISPHLIRAAIMSEDAGFCRHRGVDWRELEAAIERSVDGIARGGSTISMQTAKNLFLWPSRSYVRKAIEIPLTLAMEAAWSKKRMLEIYLNIAEWGPGLYGAEAAARHHFGKSAARLTEAEAALLAVALPAPRVRTPGAPSSQLMRMAQTVQARMRAVTHHTACVLPSARG